MKRSKRRSTQRRTRSRPNTPDPIATPEPSTPPPASEAEEEEEATPVAPRRSARASKRRTRSSPAPTRGASPTSTRKQRRRASLRSSDADDEDGDETENEPKEEEEEEEDEDDKSGDDDEDEDEAEETTPVPTPSKPVRRRGRRTSNDTEQSTNEDESATAKKAPVRKRRRATRSTTPAVSSADDTAAEADVEDATHNEDENAVVAATEDDGDTGEPDSTDDTMPKKPQHIVVKRQKRKKASKDDDEAEAPISKEEMADKSDDNSDDDISDDKSNGEKVEATSDEEEAVKDNKESENKPEAEGKESEEKAEADGKKPEDKAEGDDKGLDDKAEADDTEEKVGADDKEPEEKVEAQDKEPSDTTEPEVVTKDATANADSEEDALLMEEAAKVDEEAKSKASGPNEAADEAEDEASDKGQDQADDKEKVESECKQVPPPEAQKGSLEEKAPSNTFSIQAEKEADSTLSATATAGAPTKDQAVLPDKEGPLEMIVEASKDVDDGIKLEGKEKGLEERVSDAKTLPDTDEPSKGSNPAPNAAPKTESATEVIITPKSEVASADAIHIPASSEEKSGDSSPQTDNSAGANTGKKAGIDLVVEDPSPGVEAAPVVESDVVLIVSPPIASSDDREAGKKEAANGPGVEREQKEVGPEEKTREAQAPAEDGTCKADLKESLPEPMDVDDPVKRMETSTPGGKAAEDVVTKGDTKTALQGEADDGNVPTGEESKKPVGGVSKETATIDQMSTHSVEQESVPEDGPPITIEGDAQVASSTHDLNGTTPGLISDDNMDEKQEKRVGAQPLKTLEVRQDKDLSESGTPKEGDGNGNGREGSIDVKVGGVLPDKSTSVLPFPNGFMRSSEKKADQMLQKVEPIHPPTPRFATSDSNTAIDVVPPEDAGTREAKARINVLQNQAPRQRVVRKRLVTQPEVTIEEIKIRIYTAGVHAHRGKGAEKMFSNYWSALCRCCGVSLNGGGSDRRSRVMNGTREVIKDFLTTKKLRRLHNSLILGKTDTILTASAFPRRR
jgi:hypothetical protein